MDPSLPVWPDDLDYLVAGATLDSAGPPATAAPPRLVLPWPAPDGFEVLEELGRHSLGVIYKARSAALNRVVALKLITPEASFGTADCLRFRLEAEAVARLQHPHILPVYAVGTQGTFPYLVQEHAEGGSLAAALAEQRWRPGGRQAQARAARLVQALAAAVHYAHQAGVLHRNLKPASVVLTRADTPKLTAFGLFRSRDDRKAAADDLCYRAPEQAEGEGDRGGTAADVYALGAILYELLTGRPPFEAATPEELLRRIRSEAPVPPRQLEPTIPRALQAICLRCLEKDPARRYETAAALAEDLARFLEGRPLRPRLGGSWKWIGRGAAVVTLAGTFALGMLLGSGGRADEAGPVRAPEQIRQAVPVAKDDGQARLLAEQRLREAETKRQRAKQAQQEAERLRRGAEARCEEAEKQRQQAQRQLERAEAQQQESQRLLDEARRQHDQASMHLRQTRAALGQLVASLDRPGPPGPSPLDARRRDSLQNALQFYQDLVASADRPPLAPGERASAWRRVGDLERLLGNAKAAERAYREALQREAPPTDKGSEARLERAALLGRLAAVLVGLGKTAEAEATYRKALAMRRKLAEERPDDLARREELADTLTNLAMLYAGQGRLTEAEDAFRRSLTLLKALAAASPTVPAHRFNRAWCLSSLAAVRRDRRDASGAEQAARQAREQWQALVRDFPTVLAYREGLARALNQLALALRQTAPAEAEEALQQAREVCRQILAEAPHAADAHSELAQALHGLAGLRAERDEAPEACRLLREAVTHQRAALKAQPANLAYQRALRNHYSWLAEALVRQGDPAGARDAAVRLAAVFPDRWQDSYRAACLVARGVPLVRERDGAAAGEKHAAAAMQLLRQAVQHGPPSVLHPDQDADLAPLRSRADFRALLRPASQAEAAAPSRTSTGPAVP